MRPMATVRETNLPGIGVKHDFTTDDGREVGVLVHRDGRRDIVVYDAEDPDTPTPARCPNCLEPAASLRQSES